MTDPNTTYPAAAIGHDFTPGEHDWRHHRKMKRFSWQPVAAGIAAALAIQIVLGLFGVALGLGTTSATDPDAAPSADTVELGASMWAAVSIVSAAFYGGFIAARLSKSSCHHSGILHGIVSWAGTVIIVTCLLSSFAGSLFGGAAKIVGGATSYGMAHGRPFHMGPPGPMGGPMGENDPMKREARDLIEGNTPPSGMSADQAQTDIALQMPMLAVPGNRSDIAHKRMVADLKSQGVSAGDAEKRVSDLQAKAKETADKAAHATAKAAVAAGIILLLAALTAALGGSLGALHVAHDRERHLHNSTKA